MSGVPIWGAKLGPGVACAHARGRRWRGASAAAAHIEFVTSNPGSTAGDVARGLGLNRNSVATRLTQLAKSGELAKAERGYAAPKGA